jgi:ferredoxin
VIVSVDHDKCQGTGYCELVDATIFRVIDGKANVSISPIDLHRSGTAELVREAETLCPAGAIVVQL